MEIGVFNVRAMSFALSVAGLPSGATRIEVQISTSPRFMWALSPRFVLTVVLGAVSIVGMNQACRYFVRARPVYGNDSRGDWGNTVAVYTFESAVRDMRPPAVMIEPAIIVAPEPVLSWSSDNDVPGYPVRALGRDDPNSTWVATKADGFVSFDVQLSGAPVDTIAVLETTAAEDCSIVVRAASSRSGLAAQEAVVAPQQPFRASRNLPGRRGYHSLIRLPAPVALPWWRVEIRGSMPADTFVATYAVFGLARKTKNFAVDSKSETVVDGGAIDRDRSGNPSRTDGFRGRTVDFEIQQMTEQQYEQEFERVRWLVGTTDPVLVVPNSKRGAFLHDRILYGQMKAGRATNQSSPRFSQEFSITSLI